MQWSVLLILLWRRWNFRQRYGNFLTVMIHWAMDVFYSLFFFVLSLVWKAQCILLQTLYMGTKQLKADATTLFYFLASYQCSNQLLLSLKVSDPAKKSIFSFVMWSGKWRGAGVVAGKVAFLWKSGATH